MQINPIVTVLILLMDVVKMEKLKNLMPLEVIVVVNIPNLDVVMI